MSRRFGENGRGGSDEQSTDQTEHPGRFADGQVRTLQRRLKQWRALHGPAKEVFFAQVHHPGRLCASDFTHCTELGVTIRVRDLEVRITFPARRGVGAAAGSVRLVARSETNRWRRQVRPAHDDAGVRAEPARDPSRQVSC